MPCPQNDVDTSKRLLYPVSLAISVFGNRGGEVGERRLLKRIGSANRADKDLKRMAATEALTVETRSSATGVDWP